MKPLIRFGPQADKSVVSDYALGVLSSVLTAIGVDGATISSTSRDALGQARAMYFNCENVGVAAQLALYGQNGDKVINAYVEAKKAGRSAHDIVEAMRQKIVELGPSNVSHHCADPHLISVFDVAPSSIPASRHAAFEKAVLADSRISRFFKPPQDPAFHLEIPLPS